MPAENKPAWGSAPADPKVAEALSAAAAAAKELSAAEYSKRLVVMKLSYVPEGYTGPVSADVHEDEVSNWLQAGWVKV